MGKHIAPDLEELEYNTLLSPDLGPWTRGLCYMGVAFFAALGLFNIILWIVL